MSSPIHTTPGSPRNSPPTPPPPPPPKLTPSPPAPAAPPRRGVGEYPPAVPAGDGGGGVCPGGGAARGVGPRRYRADRRVLHVQVVLADEQHRQGPDGRDVERLVEGADIGGAVAEEGDGHLA